MALGPRGDAGQAASPNLGGEKAHTSGSPARQDVPVGAGQLLGGDPRADLRKGQPSPPGGDAGLGKETWALGDWERTQTYPDGERAWGEGAGQTGTRHRPGRSRGGRVSGWGSYKRGSRRGSAAPFPSRVILLPAAAPTVPGPAAPSTAAAILHWPAAATTTASVLSACACAASLSGPVCDDVREKTERKAAARALVSHPPRRTQKRRGLRLKANRARGACALRRRPSS